MQIAIRFDSILAPGGHFEIAKFRVGGLANMQDTDVETTGIGKFRRIRWRLVPRLFS